HRPGARATASPRPCPNGQGGEARALPSASDRHGPVIAARGLQARAGMNPRLSTNAGRVVAPSGHPQAGAAYGHPTAWGRTETDRPSWRPEELFEPMEARPFTHDRLDWCRIRHGIIRSAVEMQGAWLDAGG